MGPIEKMVQDIIDKKLSEEYPQVQLPAIMKAQVTKATPLGDEYEYDELVVENKDRGKDHREVVRVQSEDSNQGRRP